MAMTTKPTPLDRRLANHRALSALVPKRPADRKDSDGR